MKEIKGFKGFNRDMTCRGHQYAEGETYETPEVKICDKGFHFCVYPLDIFWYYGPAESVFHEVIGSGEIVGHDHQDSNPQDSKIATTKIQIGARIGTAGLIQASLDYTFAHSKKTGKKTATGERRAASATGERGAASATGWKGAASATGWSGASLTTGPYSSADAGGEESVACGLGFENRAKGALGCWIVLAERDDDLHIKSVKTAKVDGKRIKPDTWYYLKNGRFVMWKP